MKEARLDSEDVQFDFKSVSLVLKSAQFDVDFFIFKSKYMVRQQQVYFALVKMRENESPSHSCATSFLAPCRCKCVLALQSRVLRGRGGPGRDAVQPAPERVLWKRVHLKSCHSGPIYY